MRVDSLTVANVFHNSGYVHYALPHFQREYAWEQDNWATLLEDACAIHDELPDEDDDEGVKIEHFFGSLVVVNAGTFAGIGTRFALVDGQQRLTSLSLVLCALREIVREETPSLAKQINRLLVNEDQEGNTFFKVLPTTKYGDRTAYQAIICGDTPASDESRIPEAYKYFIRELKQRVQTGSIQSQRFFRVIAGAFQVVFISLNQNESPYKIFESLNAKGKPLTQADLVRNYIAMTLPIARQEDAFCEHWSPIEQMLQEKRAVGRSGIGELTAFLRHYLAHRMGTLCNEKHVYARFRDRMNREFADSSKFVTEVSTLHRFAVFYERLLRPQLEPDAATRKAMQDLEVLDLSTAFPFLLAMVDARTAGTITTAEVAGALQMLENYLMRRSLAEEPTNYLNKMFPNLWAHINTTNFLPSLQSALLERKYPSDYRVRQKLLTRPLYRSNAATRAQIVFLLERVNRHLSAKTDGYTVLDKNATIEHILPQTPSKSWQSALGAEYTRLGEFIHTLGNLTLLTQSWNSEFSNAPFAEKKARLAAHALRLNSSYFSQDIASWNESAIQARSNMLIDNILQIWPSMTAAQDMDISGVNYLWHTRVEGRVAGNAVSSWKDVVHETIKAAHKAGITDLHNYVLVGMNIVEAVAETRGFHRVAGTPFSVQGVDAGKSWQYACEMARWSRCTIDVTVSWLDKPQVPASLRGQTRRLQYPTPP